MGMVRNLIERAHRSGIVEKIFSVAQMWFRLLEHSDNERIGDRLKLVTESVWSENLINKWEMQPLSPGHLARRTSSRRLLPYHPRTIEDKKRLDLKCDYVVFDSPRADWYSSESTPSPTNSALSELEGDRRREGETGFQMLVTQTRCCLGRSDKVIWLQRKTRKRGGMWGEWERFGRNIRNKGTVQIIWRPETD